jgi:hypothetical protein
MGVKNSLVNRTVFSYAAVVGMPVAIVKSNIDEEAEK